MSSVQTQRQIESVQREIERLQRQAADVARDEAAKTEYIGKLTTRLVREKMTDSLRASKQSELISAHQAVGRLQTERAKIARRIAQKTSELHRHQKALYRQQTGEQAAALARIKRLQDAAHENQLNNVRTVIHTTSHAVQGRFDAFISHATEDKEDLVRPLAEQLRAVGFEIWYDEFQLQVGDSLRRSIDRGLASSRFGIVVLSPAFFAKNWPQYELDGLVAREQASAKIILPLWHRVSKNDVLAYSLSLADKVALSTATYTVQELVFHLSAALREPAGLSSDLNRNS